MEITKETHLITSFAGVQSSLGAAMHNAAYEVLGVNFVYIPITTNDIENAIAGVRGFNMKGNTLSMPHKQTVMQYLDKIDPVADRIGAVNTVSNQDGILTGYNSDWIGAMNSLKEVTNLAGKRVVVLGAGGAARAIVYGLTQEKAHVTLYNRTAEKAQALADDFGVTFGGDLTSFNSDTEYDVLINATSVGFASSDGQSAVGADVFRPNTVVMDVVIAPTNTVFLQHAQAAGATVVFGYRMLIHQALFQFELFTGKKAPFEVMERALLKAIG